MKNTATSYQRPWTHGSVSLALASLILVLSQFGTDAAPKGPKGPIFEPIATFTVSGPPNPPEDFQQAAEIVAATPNGHFLVYTDSETMQLGIVDIRNPAAPTEAALLPLAGSPTSVAITPNGRWILAVVHGEVEHVAVFDLRDLEAPPTIIELGGQPDSIAISPDGKYAAIAIENERDEEVELGLMPQSPPGFLTIIDLMGRPSRWTTRDVSLLGYGRFPTDPEPEFVDINSKNQVAVTLQENNHIVLIDLWSGRVIRDFTAGSVTHRADLEDDGQIVFDDVLVNSRREPDAIGWTPEGNLVVANEGDYDLDADFVGGRGFTIFSPHGAILFDSKEELEVELAEAGLYDDLNSSGKGSEPEGIEIANFGHDTYLFVGMEKALPGAVAVYRLNGKKDKPKFVQMLETGNRPEGLLAIPHRGLFVTANEGDGTISIFARR